MSSSSLEERGFGEHPLDATHHNVLEFPLTEKKIDEWTDSLRARGADKLTRPMTEAEKESLNVRAVDANDAGGKLTISGIVAFDRSKYGRFGVRAALPPHALEKGHDGRFNYS